MRETWPLGQYAMVLALGALLHWLPQWRRESLWFGVSVPPGFATGAVGRAVLNRYRAILWLATAASLILSTAAWQLAHPGLAVFSPLVQMAGASVSFALARRRVLPFASHAPVVRSAPLLESREGFPGGWGAVLLPFLILAVAAAVLHWQWDRIPTRFPLHRNIAGHVDRWGRRNFASTYGMLLTGAAMQSLLLLFGVAVLRGSRRGATSGESANWTGRFRRANLRVFTVMMTALAVLYSGIPLLPMVVSGDMLRRYVWLVPVALLAVVGLLLWPLIRLARETGNGSDPTPDDCWKLGQIYYNPGDPALMVEKRFGLGYTLNFGNPLAWGMTLLVLAVPSTFLLLNRWAQ